VSARGAARPGAVRRGLSWLSAAAALGLLLYPATGGGAPDPEPPVMVVDLHVDLPWQVHFKKRKDTLPEGMARPDTLRAGGYGGLVMAIYLPDYLHDDGAHIEDAEAVYQTIVRLIAKNPIFLPLLSTHAQPGRVATWLGIEGAGAFAADPPAIDRFIDRGARVIGPVHAKNGPLASAATGERVSWGLTDAGKALARRVYQRGALMDVSHCSDAAFDDVAAIAAEHRAPIVATHSNARALAPNPRNLTDAQLKAVARSGGVVGLNLHSPFVARGNEATIADVVAQVEHMVSVAGIDHVAVGSDFDGGIKPAKGMEDAAHFTDLARALRKRGMAEGDVLKIFSLNAWRPRR
jgi:membrane dipeptidase